jgi:pimeloyl-[acyl-carrier protein] methyl ester esterase
MTKTADSTLNVETRGHGPRLVMLHGWALNSHVWDDIVEPLAQRFTVARVDLPGHGASPWPPRFADLASLAQVLAPQLAGDAILVGWSLGSLAALQLALLHPAAVRALVLVAGTPRFLNNAHWKHGVEPDVLAEFAERLRQDQEGTVRDFLALQVRGDERAMQTLRTLRRRVLDAGPTHPAALAAGLEVLKRADLREELSAITVPALVVAGEHDRLTPVEGSRELAAGLRRARFALVEQAAHAPFISHREVFLREVEQFLARLPAPM